MKKLSALEKEKFKKEQAEARGKKKGNNIKTFLKNLDIIKGVINEQQTKKKTVCPKCKSEWEEYPCEQSVAIEKRGKCIKCLIKDKEEIQTKPYEFQLEEEK